MATELFKREKFHAALNSLEQALALTPKNMGVALNILKVLVAISQREPLDECNQALALRIVQQLAHETLDEEQQALLIEYQQQLPLLSR